MPSSRRALALTLVAATLALAPLAPAGASAPRPVNGAGQQVQAPYTMKFSFPAGQGVLDQTQRELLRGWVQDVTEGIAANGGSPADLRVTVVGRAPQCRIRADICVDKPLARSRAKATAAQLRRLGFPVQTVRSKVLPGLRGSLTVVQAVYTYWPNARWRVRNGSDETATFTMAAIWRDPRNRLRTRVLAPGEEVTAYVRVNEQSRGLMRVRVIDIDAFLPLEIRMPGFDPLPLSPLCEPPLIDGAPFACEAAGTGTMIVAPLPPPI